MGSRYNLYFIHKLNYLDTTKNANANPNKFTPLSAYHHQAGRLHLEFPFTSCQQASQGVSYLMFSPDDFQHCDCFQTAIYAYFLQITN